MAQAIPLSPSPVPTRIPSSSPRPTTITSTRRRSSISSSISPPPKSTNRTMNGHAGISSPKGKNSIDSIPNGKTPNNDESDDGIRIRKNSPRSARPSSISISNNLSTLPTIPDPDFDSAIDDSQHQQQHHGPPPPASSTQTGTGERPIHATRKRRSSSIKRKPSPGVTPTKAVDWEIPRKTLHSSIGFLTLFLNYMNPPSLKPLIQTLSALLITILTTDFFRLQFPAFAEVWETYLGFLMRESERQKINGVVWYLIGVITVLGLYPRDVAVVAILTLSWSDTTASTIGRLWGRYTKPLPSHVPGIKSLKFAPRKSLAGFLAAAITGFLIGISFWWGGSGGRWIVLDVEDRGHGYWGLWITAGVVGLGGAVVEALDLGVDDNLTLPILSGAIVWAWLAITNLILQ
ncbi:uncharacterized protein IL334_007493 [Kwoniella shivajii]|uniref:Phosphatidate cytidylyltransferase n=1 Tax=Kwoniella shivajii TaxID=564305 RepID=A0ABZ1D8T4_9TREE|nr:hypothetical protein IL334_007493 [Kwoniella shivajii]